MMLVWRNVAAGAPSLLGGRWHEHGLSRLVLLMLRRRRMVILSQWPKHGCGWPGRHRCCLLWDAPSGATATYIVLLACIRIVVMMRGSHVLLGLASGGHIG